MTCQADRIAAAVLRCPLFLRKKICTGCTGFLQKCLPERLLYRFTGRQKNSWHSPADVIILWEIPVNSLNNIT